MIQIHPKCIPQLDPEFLPASLWNKAYLEKANTMEGGQPIRIAIDRPDGTTWIYESKILQDSDTNRAETWIFCERLIKTLLWAWGGSRVRIAGADSVVAQLQSAYHPTGSRSFDFDFMGSTCFGESLRIETADLSQLQESLPKHTGGIGSLKGNRIGFDLGGSDRKCAALIDGKVVFSEEIKWSPYFEGDPAYHRAGIEDSLKRAAAHLPSVDAIGGSAAGIYINNEPRVGSLYRGISSEDFEQHIRGMFKEIQKNWNGVPLAVANDGDVTAMAGAMAIKENGVLGIAMGTSQAVGYINPAGQVTGWLNELAFAPVDYRENGPVDEWSGDKGCGAQYFSQQAVGRLLPKSGIEINEKLGLPEKREWVQEKMKQGDERATAIYSTIGTCFGYSIAHYADFYDIRHLLALGRVTSGDGGEIILKEARRVLDLEFPKLSGMIAFQTPDESTKRHGQAIAAASLPTIP